MDFPLFNPNTDRILTSTMILKTVTLEEAKTIHNEYLCDLLKTRKPFTGDKFEYFNMRFATDSGLFEGEGQESVVQGSYFLPLVFNNRMELINGAELLEAQIKNKVQHVEYLAVFEASPQFIWDAENNKLDLTTAISLTCGVNTKEAAIAKETMRYVDFHVAFTDYSLEDVENFYRTAESRIDRGRYSLDDIELDCEIIKLALAEKPYLATEIQYKGVGLFARGLIMSAYITLARVYNRKEDGSFPEITDWDFWISDAFAEMMYGHCTHIEDFKAPKLMANVNGYDKFVSRMHKLRTAHLVVRKSKVRNAMAGAILSQFIMSAIDEKFENIPISVLTPLNNSSILGINALGDTF